MSRRGWRNGAFMLIVLLGAVAFGSPGRGVAQVPQVPAVHTTSVVTRCSSGLVPWPLAEARVPALKDLPDGGTITFAGVSAKQYNPCSWWVTFSALPPVSLLNQLGTLHVGFGYTVGGSSSPARPTPFTYDDSFTGVAVPVPNAPSYASKDGSHVAAHKQPSARKAPQP